MGFFDNSKKKDGVHTEWVYDGKVKREGTYRNGKLNGLLFSSW